MRFNPGTKVLVTRTYPGNKSALLTELMATKKVLTVLGEDKMERVKVLDEESNEHYLINPTLLDEEKFTFPTQKYADVAENIHALALSFRMTNPILSIEMSHRIAERAVFSLELYPDEWKRWEDLPKAENLMAPRMIVGVDCLGFVHDATHLIASQDRTASWVERWRAVEI